ncbi:MAG: hypothetical protein B6D41_18085, partial [Chloroflexi bacterium UTCFX4]
AQVKGFASARHKAFNTRAEAEAAFGNRAKWVASEPGPEWVASEPGSDATHSVLTHSIPTHSVPTHSVPTHSIVPRARWQQLRSHDIASPILPSYCADAACSGNPGALEYRAVNTETGAALFNEKFPEGTNNIGEFLALVDTLRILRERQDAAPIYSDSRIAINWVRAKRCKTQLLINTRNAELFERIERAEEWLRAHKYPNKILKWDTKEWGEIPADYGRK